ncbi:hypothetical protein [Enterocloster bolteae]|jgi:hypothetical protein|uniref:hypothetical protein n=1 Tax=Enterocloster bolteae TaxID=208479 RepID=UPI00210B3515|nr:hypothetical protein [Enterocloster bolteae]MCQ4754637.1 hypothetical protein [Enterocloster bolteae]
MNTTEQLQYIEHKWLPWFYYSGSKKVMELLKEQGGNLFIDLLHAMNKDDIDYSCPFHSDDFRVDIQIDSDSNVTFCQINMPSIQKALLCRRIYLVHNEDFSSRFVYTIELTMNDDYWICGWSENNTYMVFDGKLTDDSVDEFKQVKKLFLLNSHDMPIASMSNDFPMNSPE